MAAYKVSLSFLSRASVEMLRGEGPLVRWEGIGFGLKGGESMAGSASDGARKRGLVLFLSG